MYPIALHHSIDGGGRHVWYVDVLVSAISLVAEVGRTDWKVIMYRVIDEGCSVVVTAFYNVDEAWVMNDVFSVLNAYCSQADFGADRGFMYSTHALCVSGFNLGY